MSEPDLTLFRQRIAERRAQKEAEEAAKRAQEFPEDLIPEVDYDQTPEQKELDTALDSIDIIDAYRRWCSKMVPVVRSGQREGIKISCPIPGHIDNDPSAWINLDNQTWFCGGCQQGGDKYDIAAYWLGYPVPGYKEGSNFHTLRERMAEDFGYTVHHIADGSVSVVPPVIVSDKEDPESAPEAPMAPVVSLYDDDDGDDQTIEMPGLDWRPVTPQGTFLDAYMQACIVDDVPEEYHFFHALLALGFALGRDVTLFDQSPVYGNLFVCTLGRSGLGKSKARKHLDRLLSSALPHDWSSSVSKGVRRIQGSASGEALVRDFSKPIEDPADPRKIIGYAPVRGMIDYNELSNLIGRAGRAGSILKPILMQFYDNDDVVETTSITSGGKRAELPFASALTTTQPKALRTLLNEDDDASGFLNRWVFVPGTEKKQFAVGGVMVDPAPAKAPLLEIHGWASTFGADHIMWSPEAEKIWTDFFYDTVVPLKKESDNDLIVRIDLLMKKLMLLFAANRMERVLSEQSVQDALYCFKYLVASYGVPAAEIGNTLAKQVTDSVIFQVSRISKKHSGRGATASEVWQILKKRKGFTPRLIQEALETLVKLEVLQIEKSQSGRIGRPTVRYNIA